MTSEAVPSFDLYEELQVARHASEEVIEAAFRYLVKHHRPDPSGPGADARLERLNQARDWLLDPDRRRRYDAQAPAPIPGRRLPAATPVPGRDVSSSGPASGRAPAFGPNAPEVRAFLADLRALDWDRALQVWEGRNNGRVDDREAARRMAQAAASGSRHQSWLAAREAAIVISRGKLGGSTVTAQVSEMAADAAGAIVVGDLMPARDVELLVGPWAALRERGPVLSSDASPRSAYAPPRSRPARARARLAATPLAAGAAVSVETLAVASREVLTKLRAGSVGSSVVVPSAALAVTVVALAIGIGVQSRPVLGPAEPSATPLRIATPGPVVIGPSQTLAPPFPSSPVVVPLESLLPGPSSSTSPATPGATQPTGGVTATPDPPGPTPRPGQTPGPTSPVPPSSSPAVPTLPPTLPPPTPAPTPPPTPTPDPPPTPTPAALCTVPDFVNLNTDHAAGLWSGAGFDGLITYDPAIPPQFKIAWQSLAAGGSEPCSSAITLRKVAP